MFDEFKVTYMRSLLRLSSYFAWQDFVDFLKNQYDFKSLAPPPTPTEKIPNTNFYPFSQYRYTG